MAVDPKRVQALFAQLVELPEAERGAVLERECGSDEELRRYVAELLQAHGEPDSYLDQPPGKPLREDLAAIPHAEGSAWEQTATGAHTPGPHD